MVATQSTSLYCPLKLYSLSGNVILDQKTHRGDIIFPENRYGGLSVVPQISIVAFIQIIPLHESGTIIEFSQIFDMKYPAGGLTPFI